MSDDDTGDLRSNETARLGPVGGEWMSAGTPSNETGVPHANRGDWCARGRSGQTGKVAPGSCSRVRRRGYLDAMC